MKRYEARGFVYLCPLYGSKKKAALTQVTFPGTEAKFNFNILCFLKKEVAKPHIHVSDMKKSIQTYLRDSGWEVRLQNAVYAQLKR